VTIARVPFEQAVLDTTGGNRRLLTSEYKAEGSIPVIDQGQAEIAGFTDDPDTVCFRDGPVILFGDHTRKLKFVDFDFAIGADGVKVLKPLPGFNARFLFHFLKTVRLPNNLGYSRHFKFLKECSVPKPAPDVQERIAAILDKADSLRRKRQEAIRLADDLLRAVFYEKLGDPVTNPKGFPTIRIDQLCEVATGSTPSRNRADYYDGPHPWIKTGEVDTPLIMSADEHISDDAIRETNCKLFPVGTLLIAMYGQGKTRGKVGMLGIPAATNQACAAILPSQNINQQFLHTQLTLMYEHLRAMGRGGNQENLNLGMIKSLEVLTPPSNIVDEFIKVREHVSKMSSKALCAQADSEAMLQSLAAKFFD
jgi:type I restriction enzyme S subunit